MSVIFINSLSSKSRIVLFRLRGQSNAQGSEEKANFPSKYYGALPYAKIYWPFTQEWQDYEIGVNNAPDRGETSQTDFAGVIPILSEMIFENNGLTSYWCKYAQGGTALAQRAGEDDWNTASTGEYFDQSISRWNESKALIRKPRLIVDLWIHGHEDAKNTAEANAYEANLTSFVSANTDRDLFISTRLSDNNNSDPTNRATINQAMIDVAASDPTYYTTPTNYLVRVGDELHYSYDGYVQMAQDLHPLLTL